MGGNFELEELKEAIHGMKKGKAPGMDELTAEIWKDVWKTCGEAGKFAQLF